MNILLRKSKKQRNSNFAITAVGVLAMFLSGVAFAQLSSKPLTMQIKEVPLSRLLYVFSESANIKVLNPEVIPDVVTVIVDLDNVPADEIFDNILRCGGLGYVMQGDKIELIQHRRLEKNFLCTLIGKEKVEQGKLVYRD